MADPSVKHEVDATAGSPGRTASLRASSLSRTVKVEEPKRKKPRVQRGKIIDSGYVFNYDKDSVGGDRSFWRCERKGECPARVHTDPLTGVIVKRLHFHTHPATCDATVIGTKRRPNMIQIMAETSLASMLNDSAASVSDLLGSDDPMTSTNGQLMNAIAEVVKKEQDEENNGSIDGNDDSGMSSDPGDNMPLTLPVTVPGGGVAPSDDLDMNNEFGLVFELTKQVFALVRKEARRTHGPITFKCRDVKRFIKMNYFSAYMQQLCRFTIPELKALSREECRLVLGDDADGVRLYHILLNTNSSGDPMSGEFKEDLGESSSSSSSHPSQPLRLYICPKDNAGEIIYQLITLPKDERTVEMLREHLHRKDVLSVDEYTLRICIVQGRMTVELCDEMIEQWKGDQVFSYRKAADYIVLERISS